MTKSGYDGLQKDIKKIKLPKIEVWENEYTGKDYIVRIDTSEFTCICPKTGLPDFAEIEIAYAPDKWCLELKSFKEYIVAYRDIGIFHEHAVNRMLDDLTKSCRPKRMKITGMFNTRGGITTTVEAEYSK
ncbi:MAG: preQ(1) synthase [Candidatus Omnitrophota bacterium]|nr:preQ(1) synthase [Candidatus Omnitrophota bacterium]